MKCDESGSADSDAGSTHVPADTFPSAGIAFWCQGTGLVVSAVDRRQLASPTLWRMLEAARRSLQGAACAAAAPGSDGGDGHASDESPVRSRDP
ncbi:unnamed protein product (plasmid) [Mycetohabitans rhizoxinica HKI 454]|jgi:hypothetical protein|uniref:Uncharacterized protein n=1 Tax=Mycetohabitans rhizoxinica (strain DSM 19002 / CIP 109453 / HKI 454) TaxID=882378 RepID=E5AU68_MYCRK|nr:unnamed protein product [Mycetohabitans rhizoxinica HKI 454]